jgi:hypothetical protein
VQDIIESKIQGVRYNINSKEIKSIYNPIFYDIDKIRKIIKQVYPNSSDDIDIIYKCINQIKKELDAIKKD